VAHKVGIIAGDGIGPEVIAEGLKVIRAAGVVLDTTDYDLGAARYLRDGTILPDEIVEEWRGLDALYHGAVGWPGVRPGVIERGFLLKMRFDLDLFINLRPFVDQSKGLDFIVIRENTEGTYAGEGGFLRKGTPHEIATQGSVNTRFGVERCVRYAFELAQSRDASTSRSCTRPTC
jgi:3-isopropylmalate dehydrogenase